MTQGFDADHTNIELLRLKNFTIGRKFADEEILGKGSLEKICTSIKCLLPFVSFATTNDPCQRRAYARTK